MCAHRNRLSIDELNAVCEAVAQEISRLESALIANYSILAYRRDYLKSALPKMQRSLRGKRGHAKYAARIAQIEQALELKEKHQYKRFKGDNEPK